MTCEQALHTIFTRDALTMTRGERAAVIGHIIGCVRCQRVHNAFMSTAGPPDAVTRKLMEKASEVTEQDMIDPEYVNVVFGSQSS